ncbi:MAG: NAD-dependent epimerase/dehydratase family protein [Armatimonadetes bacterium]|nr:MAG: NAD-dependent epimerase/dehydratase family protein [Armatimonadota bacterium]
MPKSVVTGGAGFIGSNLVDLLVDEGHEILVLDDLSSGSIANLKDARSRGDVTLHQIDVGSNEVVDLVRAFQPQTVFHLAAQIDVRHSVADPVMDARVNVLGTVNLLEAARHGNAERFVFASSGGATFGDTFNIPTPESQERKPESPYGVSKSVVDQYFDYYDRTHGLDYMSLGFANVYGPRQDPHGEAGVVAIFIGALLAHKTPTIFGDGLQTRDFVFVEDVADALLRASRIGGSRYLNIGTGVETSVLKLYDVIAGATGVDVAPIMAAAKRGEQLRSCLDSSAAQAHLGWEPWTSLEDGIARTVEWARS